MGGILSLQYNVIYIYFKIGSLLSELISTVFVL